MLVSSAFIIAIVATFARIVLEHYGAIVSVVVGPLIRILYFILFYNLSKFVQERSNSKDLLDNFKFAFFCECICFVFSIITASLQDDTNGTFYIYLVLSLIFVVVHLVCWYLYYKELSQITNQPLFLYAFWCNASFILSPVGFVLWLVAWLGIKEIKQHSALSPK